jgi:hypothetical protein
MKIKTSIMIYRFLLKDIFTFIIRVVQRPGISYGITIFMTILIIQPVIGQKFSDQPAEELYFKDLENFQGGNPENMTMNLSAFPKVSGNLPTLRSDNSIWQPDSVYEYHTYGFTAEYKRSYYRYGQIQKQDSVISYFYDIYGNKLKKQEIHIFNENGKLTLYLLKTENPWDIDANLIDYTRREYTYQGELLVHQRNRDEEYYWDSNSDKYYFYDYEGRLILDSIFINEEFAARHEYEYIDSDSLKYQYERGSEYVWIKGYFYEYTDTSLLTTVCQSKTFEAGDILADTITQWWALDYFLETFDAFGKTKTFSHSNEIPGLVELSPNYRSEYTYSDNSALIGVRYFDWEGNAEEGNYVESARRNYEYDNNGNLKVFEQTFWDARVEKWETEIRREYFYSPLTSVESIPGKKKTSLRVYPNPASDILFIQDINASSTYSIYNLSGITVAEAQLGNGNINVSSLEPGIYIVIVDTGSKFLSGKFIKN